MYVSFCGEDAPVRSLKALKKVRLAAGAKETVKLTLTNESFGLFDKEGILKLNKGDYIVSVGDSQPDERSKELTGVSCSTFKVNVAETSNI